MSTLNRCQVQLNRILVQANRSAKAPLASSSSSSSSLSLSSSPHLNRISACHFSLLCQTRRDARKQIAQIAPAGAPTRFARRTFGNAQVMRPYVDPKLSYAYARSQEHLIHSTVTRELQKQTDEAPDRVAFISHEERITKTYRQLEQDINRLSRALITRFNIEKGDRIGIFAYNCYNWVVAQYACTRVGAVLTSINPSYKGDELAFVLQSAQVKCLLTHGPKSNQRHLNDHLRMLQSQPVREVFARGESGTAQLESVIFMDEENDYNMNEIDFKLKNCRLFQWSDTQTAGDVFRSAQEAEAAGVRPDDAFILSPDLVAPDDLFAIYYTSGTTGKPKGACISHSVIVNNVRICQIRLRNGRPRNWRCTVATTLPMFHMFAGVLVAVSPLVSNTAVVLTGHKYDIPSYVESIREHGCNNTALTPTILIDLLSYIEQNKLNDLPLKIVQPGGAPCPPELVTRAFKTLRQLEEIRPGYGSTENGAVSTYQTIHEPEATRAFTAGPPIDFTEIRVVKPSDQPGGSNECVPLGEKGEIQTRGHNTMIEYLDQPDKTREVITPSRWYRTGDIGFMHPHGSIEISGRVKHMIIKGGENIYPEEVEQMMIKMDCIQQVQVVGVPDDRFGEQVCAWVKLKPDYFGVGGDYSYLEGDEATSSEGSKRPVSKRDIIKYCKEHMTYFKVPKFVLFVDDFPMTPTKKVQNHKMVEKSIVMLGLDKKQQRSQQKQ